jgi:6-phosphofructokinase 1
MRKIAVLTSGGDGPGLNACIRAVAREAFHHGMQVYGVRWGYKGLINGEIDELTSRDVGGIMNRGGTFLGTARCPEFKEIQVRRTALRQMNQHGIEGLVVIGGNGSLAGALALHKMGFPTFGVPASIDNDINGTDMAVGVDTTLNTILDAIDRIKDTAASHQRAFLIEVMGRDCGYLALVAGVTGGAEAIIIPEVETDPEAVATELRAAYERGKSHALVVVAEGAQYNAEGLAHYFQVHQERLGFDLRVTRLGHVQRGGAPGAFDRLLATRLGAAATEHLARRKHGILMGLLKGEIVATPLDEVVANKKPLDLRLLELARILAR